MIRIDRGPEPDALTLARDEQLARARLRGGPPVEIQGYQGSREMLSERQIYKCAYCELTSRAEAAPIEHYRPKGRADDIEWSALATGKSPTPADLEDDGRFDRGLPPRRDGFTRVRWKPRRGYWWLAWTWENLVFGCTGCNSGVKGCRFPQARTGSALRPHEPPPGEERPLLLDPTDPAEDPLDHIQYRRVNKRWIPTWRDASPQGAWTIALLRLDTSPALLTAYDRRVKRLEGCARRLDDVRAAGGSSVRELWQALCDDVLAPNEELLGLTYDWLDARYPAAWREAEGLSLDKPTLRVPDAQVVSTARPAVAPIAALAGLPERLADLIRVARNYRVPTGERLQPSVEHLPLPELLAEILVLRPNASDEELGALLRREPTTIRKNRR